MWTLVIALLTRFVKSRTKTPDSNNPKIVDLTPRNNQHQTLTITLTIGYNRIPALSNPNPGSKLFPGVSVRGWLSFVGRVGLTPTQPPFGRGNDSAIFDTTGLAKFCSPTFGTQWHPRCWKKTQIMVHIFKIFLTEGSPG